MQAFSSAPFAPLRWGEKAGDAEEAAREWAKLEKQSRYVYENTGRVSKSRRNLLMAGLWCRRMALDLRAEPKESTSCVCP